MFADQEQDKAIKQAFMTTFGNVQDYEWMNRYNLIKVKLFNN